MLASVLLTVANDPAGSWLAYAAWTNPSDTAVEERPVVDMRLDIRATRVSPDSSFCMPTTAQPAQTKKMAAPAQKQSLESEERGMLGMGIACTCRTHGFDPMCRKLTDQIRNWMLLLRAVPARAACQPEREENRRADLR
jgi:hypothetical protein